jgi:hypothetical protein
MVGKSGAAQDHFTWRSNGHSPDEGDTLDESDALVESCERLRRLAGDAERTLHALRTRAALRLAAVVSVILTALSGCVVALALTWDGRYRLVTAMLLWGTFAVVTLYLRARLEREEEVEHSRAELVHPAQARWALQARGAREARPLTQRSNSTTKLTA